MNTQRVEGHTPDAWLIDSADAYFATVDSHTAQQHEIKRATVTPLYKFSDIERLEKVNEALVRALEIMLGNCGGCHGKGSYTKHVTMESVGTFDCEVCATSRATLALAKEPA